jgi:hypothetical protein
VVDESVTDLAVERIRRFRNPATLILGADTATTSLIAFACVTAVIFSSAGWLGGAIQNGCLPDERAVLPR